MNFKNDHILVIIDRNGVSHQIANKIYVADNFFTRFMGLMGQKKMPVDSCLLLTPCSSIHMFFMKFPIDVVYANKDMRIVRVVKNIKPWHIDFGYKKAKCTFELPAGTINFEATGGKIRLC